MKKSFIVLLGFLILFLGSCQENGYIEDIQESTISKSTSVDLSNTKHSDLVERLQSFNDSLGISSVSTNGIDKGKLKRGLNIALADLLGVYEGVSIGIKLGGCFGPNAAVITASVLGPFVGAYRSYSASLDTSFPGLNRFDPEDCVSAYIEMKETITDFSPYYPKKVALNLPQEKQEAKIYGAKHNLLLKNLKNKKFSSTTLQEALDNGIVTSEEHYALTHPIVKNALSHLPKIEDYADMEGLGELPNKIIDLYSKAVKNYTVSYSSLEMISNRYLSEIFSTIELEEEESFQIASTICALVSSTEYWRVYTY